MATAPIPGAAFRLKHILFTTDFSPGSEAALAQAQTLGERFGSTVHLLHVLDPAPNAGLPLEFAIPLDSEQRCAEEHMNRLMAAVPPRKLSQEVLIRRGPLWQVIEDAIRYFQIDLVVVGTHGRRGFKKVVLGSSAEEIFRRAACPVLTIGPHCAAHQNNATDCIVYATDFSAASLHAVTYAAAFARESHSRLLLLHVLPAVVEISSTEREELDESVRRQLSALMTPAMDIPFPPTTYAVSGPPAETILRLAAEEKARMIVMGARRPALVGLSSHLPWATAHRVVCEAQCPVLTVRA